MTIAQFLTEATELLQKAGVESARLDVLILLEDLLERDRSRVLAHAEQLLTKEQVHKLNNYIVQRSRHTPLAYIRGHVAFFGRDFIVNEHVLIPRPETEAVIELLKECSFSKPPCIADVGTGSGCIGITAALELPTTRVHFYDTDKAALEVALSNARRLHAHGEYYRGNVLDPWRHDYDVVLANLPYIPDVYPINKAAGFEPELALFSGEDGLNHYRLLWRQIKARAGKSGEPDKPAHVIIEAFPAQHADLDGLAAAAGYRLHATRGYVQHFMSLP